MSLGIMEFLLAVAFGALIMFCVMSIRDENARDKACDEAAGAYIDGKCLDIKQITLKK